MMDSDIEILPIETSPEDERYRKQMEALSDMFWRDFIEGVMIPSEMLKPR